MLAAGSLTLGAGALAACGGDDAEVAPVATDTTVDDTPTDEAPADEAPAQPADEAPADDTPAPEAPADEAPAPETPADDTPADEAPAGTGAAPEILRFSAPLVGGGELDLAAFGDRPVLLWFWAPF